MPERTPEQIERDKAQRYFVLVSAGRAISVMATSLRDAREQAQAMAAAVDRVNA